MTTARARAKTATALGLITMLFGAFLVIAPGAGADRGAPPLPGQSPQAECAEAFDHLGDVPAEYSGAKWNGNPDYDWTAQDESYNGFEAEAKTTKDTEANSVLVEFRDATDPVFAAIVKQGSDIREVIELTGRTSGEFIFTAADDLSHFSLCSSHTTLEIVKVVEDQAGQTTDWTFPFETDVDVAGPECPVGTDGDFCLSDGGGSSTGAVAVTGGAQYTVTETSATVGDRTATTTFSCTGAASHGEDDDAGTERTFVVTVATGGNAVCTFTNTFATAGGGSPTPEPTPTPTPTPEPEPEPQPDTDTDTDTEPTPEPEPEPAAPQPASLRVVKEMVGDPAVGWEFTLGLDGPRTEVDEFFVLAEGDVELTTEDFTVPAGTYTVRELADDDAQTTVQSIACVDDDGAVDDAVVGVITDDGQSGSVTVDLAAGQSMTCTFVNAFTEVGGITTPPPPVPAAPPAPAPAPAPAPPPAPAPAPAATPTSAGAAPQVLGATVTRLPKTGDETATLALAGLSLLIFGAALTAGSRRQLRRIG